MTKHSVYYHFDHNEECIYVGCSHCPCCRVKTHRSASAWMPDVMRIEIRWFDTRDEAYEFELLEIKRLTPKYNRAGVKRKIIRPTQQNGARLLAWMAKNNISIQGFSEKSGLSTETVKAICANKRSANYTTAQKIFDGTGRELRGYLFTRPPSYLASEPSDFFEVQQ